ncbi:hypothetical protein [Alkaliphilus hydrothermalis]|uniref:Uncharacterized protein n=1 Tax=Alkaliphilus hydrothermalis TaxID=1482730 RepID=A0ABS2NTV6_9FIRM|nr:hypothetical protein [Alkaliphilus hydrothermalis]MBM7616395.1 hypothetical protein [Alkaliphilus hydrothermalis]
MDEIIYTGKVTKEEVFEEMNEILSRILDDLIEQGKIGVDEK